MRKGIYKTYTMFLFHKVKFTRRCCAHKLAARTIDEGKNNCLIKIHSKVKIAKEFSIATLDCTRQIVQLLMDTSVVDSIAVRLK